MTVHRDTVLSEIRRLSVTLGRTPGKNVFAKETGIKEGEWCGVHWARWGDAVREAGLEANSLQGRSDREEILASLYLIASEFGRMPTEAEMKIYSKQHPGFPSRATFRNILGDKHHLTEAFKQWMLENKPGDPLLGAIRIEYAIQQPIKPERQQFGWVYLLKSGDFYKVGRSAEIERRLKEVTVALPERVELTHAIKTDDPAGIEAYWHRRFADRRANGEWFRLTGSDVIAFKSRKSQ